MFGKDLLIKKYPHISSSPNLIEYFEIIGYQESMVPQILDYYRKKENPISPTIISSITSKSDYLNIKNDSIISNIYIENPYPLLINKNNTNQEPPPISKVINHFCFSSENGSKNVIYSVFGFKFYEKYRYYITSKDFEEYYIPKAFCIISQYSFYTLFNYICSNLYIIMKKNNLIDCLPFELIIYNIVNFIPSPITYGMHLNFFGNILKVPDYELNQLSGYNYLDFDLSQIFNLLPLNLVLEIFIFTFIEKKIVFFSKNLEILNMTMFIMYALNYPCNDGRYFFYIISFSSKKLTEDNKLLGIMDNYMVGVNDSYNDEINTSEIGDFHLVVDIDNKKIILKENKDIRDLKGLSDLYELKEFIENIIKEKDKIIEKSFLKPFILRVKKNLDLFLTKKINDFNSNSKNKYVDFFNTSKDIHEINKGIQEIFYDFCLNILVLFYHDYSLSSSFEKINKNDDEEIKKSLYNMVGVNDVEQIEYINEESIFFRFFRETMKFKIYFENFIQSKRSLELYKVALLYSDEFINIKIMDLDNKIWNEISLFEIIDSLYYPNLKQQIVSITLNNIFDQYSENLKKYFNHFDSKDKNKSNQNQLVALNKKIINKFIYILKIHYSNNELNEIFPYLRLKEENPIEFIDRREILNTIQNTFEKKNLIEKSNYLIYSLVYVFSISITQHSHKSLISYIERLIKIISKIKYKLFTRHFVYILIKTFYKYYLIHKDNQIYPDLGSSSIKIYYYMLIDYVLKKNSIIPDEEMLQIFHNFFFKILLKERDSLNKNEIIIDNEIKENGVDEGNNFRIEKGKNFLCFMKHCFTNKKIFKPSTMIKVAMKENTNSNIIIINGQKSIQPTINIKINEYFYSSFFFSPKKIYKTIQSTYNDFFDKGELDMSQLMIKNVRDVICNLIQYGLELNGTEELIPIDYLVYTFYAFKDHEKKYGNNNVPNQKN